MASAQAPLFGLDASGSIGGAITFSKWKGRNVVRIKSTPSNPRSAAQTSTRAMMSFLGNIWASLSPTEKAAWQTLADADRVSPFNAFVKYNMKRWTQFTTPYDMPTPTAGAVPVMGALTVTGGVGQISVSQVITTPNQIWGMLVAVSTSNAFTPAKTDIWMVPKYSSSPVTCVVTNLVAGTYYVRTAGFDQEGELSAFVAQQTATVT